VNVVSDFPSYGDLFRVARDQVLVLQAKLSRDAVERPGADANAMLAAACAAADQVVLQLLNVAAGAYLTSASGALLDRRMFDLFGLVRVPAGAGLVTQTFSLPAPAAGAFDIPAGTQVQTPDGVKYATVVDLPFPAGDSSLDVTARSVLTGSGQQVKAGTLSNIVSTISGAPAGLLTTNALASAGATDEETDAAFRARGRQFFTTVRRATLSSLVQGALAVPGVVTASVIEALDPNGRPSGVVELVVADAFTPDLMTYTPTPVAYQAQAQALAVAVSQALDEYRGAGIYVPVTVAVVAVLSVQLGLHFATGADPVATALRAQAAIVEYTNALPPGSTWVANTALGTLRGVPGLVFTGDELISPLGDVVPAGPLQVIRTALNLVNPAIPPS